MTFSMGQKRWNETWGSRRRSSLGGMSGISESGVAGGGGVGVGRGGGGGMEVGGGSEIGSNSLTDCSSLERPDTTSHLLLQRENSTASSHIDCTSYQQKMQGWSAHFHDPSRAGGGGSSETVAVPQRPGTSINPTRPMNLEADAHRQVAFLRANRGAPAFPAKPRELYDPLDGLMPSNRLVAQRKFYVLPSIGGPGDLLLRRQRSNMETLNQLDYARDNYEEDAEFFAELIELKRESGSKRGTPLPQSNGRCSLTNPLPPIQKLRDVVGPRGGSYIAELDEDRLVWSGRQSPSESDLSDCFDVEEFRARTPDPDYADISPRKGSPTSFSQVHSAVSNKKSSTTSKSSSLEDSRPDIMVGSCGNG